MQTRTFHTDVAIIGAGPVGLFAAFECGMLKMHCLLIDALDTAGGQCSALYPEKPIYDIPAHPAIEAAQLVAQLEAQISPFRTPRLLGRHVVALSGISGAFTLATDKGDTISAKAVLIAAGAGAFGPNRPPLAGLAKYEANGGVQYSIRSREDFRGRHVVIAGGGDSAIDWALALRGVADRIYLVHRRHKFRATPDSAAKLGAAAAEGQIDLIVPYQLCALHGKLKLTHVEVADLDGRTKLLEADRLLPFFGLSMDLGPITKWGLELALSHIKVSPATCETNTRGVFAIGDVATYPGKLKLILQGFSEAAMAAHAIHPIVHPDEVLRFVYSTSRGVPDPESDSKSDRSVAAVAPVIGEAIDAPTAWIAP